MRSDVLVAGGIIALCAFAVVKQLDGGEAEPPVRALAPGETIDPDLRVTLIGDPPFVDALGAYLGERATVLLTWSVPCPCVDHVEHRLKEVYARFLPRDGVAWVAVDGEPLDTVQTQRDEDGSVAREGVFPKMVRLRAFYKMVLDPRQRLVRRLGLYQAAQVAVIDGDRRLVYRGPLDDDYDAGKAGFLAEVLERLVGTPEHPAASALEPFERPPTYGCLFNNPASCFAYQDRGKP